LLRLQSESFVRLIARRGFVVNTFNREDFLDLFWAQATIAAELADRAALRMSKIDMARLQKIQDDHEAAFAAGDVPLVSRLGHEFHRAINLSAQSPRLAQLLGSLTKQLPNRFYAAIEGNLRDAVEYHPQIIDAIVARDPKAASSLMFRHIIAAGEHLISMLERQDVWGDSTALNAPEQSRPSKTKSKTKPKVTAKTAKTRRPGRPRTALSAA
jgi:DNA-binding GntR family transcriptional regulator